MNDNRETDSLLIRVRRIGRFSILVALGALALSGAGQVPPQVGGAIQAVLVSVVALGVAAALTRRAWWTEDGTGRPRAGARPIRAASDAPKSPSRVVGLMIAAASVCIAIILGVGAWPVVQDSVRALGTQQRRATASGLLGDPSAYARGIRAYENRDFHTAEQLFRMAGSANGSSAETRNMLAYALIEQNKGPEALAAARQALDLSPRDPSITDTVGEMLERTGRLKEAVRYYRKSMALGGEATTSVETLAKLGRTLLALGRRSEAVARLQSAVRANVGGRWDELARSLLRGAGAPIPMDLRPTRSLQKGIIPFPYAAAARAPRDGGIAPRPPKHR